jgi:hypothetical protein
MVESIENVDLRLQHLSSEGEDIWARADLARDLYDQEQPHDGDDDDSIYLDEEMLALCEKSDDPECHLCPGARCKFCTPNDDHMFTCSVTGIVWGAVTVNDAITAGNVVTMDENGVSSSPAMAAMLRVARRRIPNSFNASKLAFSMATNMQTTDEDDERFIQYGIRQDVERRERAGEARDRRSKVGMRRCRTSKRDIARVNMSKLADEAMRMLDDLVATSADNDNVKQESTRLKTKMSPTVKCVATKTSARPHSTTLTVPTALAKVVPSKDNTRTSLVARQQPFQLTLGKRRRNDTFTDGDLCQEAIQLYIQLCNNERRSVDMNEMHRVWNNANEKRLAATRKLAIQVQCIDRTMWYMSMRQHIAHLVVCLWRCAVQSPYMLSGKRTNDNFRPYCAGIFFSLKRGVRLENGTVLIPRCTALSSALPSSRLTQRLSSVTHVIHLSAHRGVCTLHRAIRSVPVDEAVEFFADAIAIARVLYEMDRLLSR